MNKVKIIILDVAGGTLTNADALPLKIALDSALAKGNTLILSFGCLIILDIFAI